LWSGCECDLLAGEVFELADQIAFSSLGIDSGLIEAGAQVVKVGLGVGQ
jgi:hypothetical protein